MRIDILTLFPGSIDGFINESIIKRAINNKQVEINLIDFRKYSKLNNNQVDDTAFGGKGGMVIMCKPIVDCLNDIKTSDSYVILMDPKGKLYNQKKAKELSQDTGNRLRKSNLYSQNVSIWIKYTDFTKISKQIKLNNLKFEVQNFQIYSCHNVGQLSYILVG